MGRIIAVVGPSGVGKDSVMQALVARDPRLRLATRVITRPSDAGGEIFEGISTADFAQRASEGEFALSWPAHGLHYGIPIAACAPALGGSDVLVNLSRAVLPAARNRFARFVVILLSADRAVLAERLALRGRECTAEIERRLQRADMGLPDGIPAHRIDNSGPLERTVDDVLRVLYPVRA